jgi:hypothetical protein
MYHELKVRSQSRQSTRLLLQSSDLGQLPPPHPQANTSPPFGSGGVTHFLAGEGGVGGSQFARGDRHCGTLGIFVLCGFANVYLITNT